MNFLCSARVGHVDEDLLMKVNSRIVLSRQQAIQSTSPLASWVAHTRAAVAKYNEYDFKEKVVRQYFVVAEFIMIHTV